MTKNFFNKTKYLFLLVIFFVSFFNTQKVFAVTAPTVLTVNSLSVTDSTVTLKGNISALGTYTSVSVVGFEYGLTTSYGASSSNSGTFPIGNFLINITGLSCSSTYHFRAFAINNTNHGSDMTFNTLPCIGAGGNVSGYVWSSNTGWISLDCAHGSSTGGSICGSSSYTVNVTPNAGTQIGLFTGYAWSSGVGWISFNPADLSSSTGASLCGTGTGLSAQARINLTTGSTTSGQISGWARAISATGGWDGCISLRGSITGTTTTYGLSYNYALSTNNITGYAWGGPIMGWISFTNATLNLSAPTLSFTGNGSTTVNLPSSGGAVNLIWITTNLATLNCNASGNWSTPVSSGGGSQTISFDTNYTTSTSTKTYTISGCTSISGATVATSTVTVNVAPSGGAFLSFLANGSTNLNISSGDTVNLTWEVQNVATSSCVGTSSGSYSGWASTTKDPSYYVGSASMTFNEFIGTDHSITSNRTYTLTCTGLPSQTVNINVGGGPGSVDLTIDGDSSNHSLTSAGGPVTLAWTLSNLSSTACTASSSAGDWSGSIDPSVSSSTTITLPANTTTTDIIRTYTLGGCVGLDGLVVPDRTVTATINGTGPTLVFYANGSDTTSIDSGSAVTLTWQLTSVATNACVGTSSGSFSNWNSTIKNTTSATSFTETIGGDGSITASRTYTMTCTGLPAQTVTININTPPSGASVLLTANTLSPELDLPSSGGTVNLAWTTLGLDTTNCLAESSDENTSHWSGLKTYLGGSASFSLPSNTSTTDDAVRTYTLSGCKAAGVDVAPVTVTVVVAKSGSPFLSFIGTGGSDTGDNITVYTGDAVTLSWTVQNINGGSCVGSSNNSYATWTGATSTSVKSPSSTIGSTATTSTENVGSSAVPRAYTLTCTGTNSATIYKTVTINVDNSVPSLSLLASDGTATGTNITVASTASVTLTWQMQNIAHGSCMGTSFGAYSLWNNTSKYPLIGDANVGATVTSHSEVVGSATTSRTYMLTCTGTNGMSISDTVVVGVVSSTPFLSFIASGGMSSGSSITVMPTEPVTLNWTVQDEGTCTGASSAGDWGGSQSTTSGTTPSSYSSSLGTISSSPRTYTMTCGTLVKTVTVYVDNNCYSTTCTDTRVANVDFTVNGDPSIVLPASASTATLVWSTSNLTSAYCTASSSAGDWTSSSIVSSGGIQTLSYLASTSTVARPRTYTLSGCLSAIDASIVPPVTVTVTIAPYGKPFMSFFVNGQDAITLSPAGSTATLSWQLQNIATSTCVGDSSGSFNNWNSSIKGPSPAVGTTVTPFSETIGGDGSINSTRWYTLSCTGTPSQTVTINVDDIPPPSPACPGDPSCITGGGGSGGDIIKVPLIGGIKRPPWLEL